jgi:hypothetical protein
MDRVVKFLGGIKEHSDLSAAVTVIAMLIVGVLAKLEIARWGLYVVMALCLVHIVLTIGRLATHAVPEPGE